MAGVSDNVLDEGIENTYQRGQWYDQTNAASDQYCSCVNRVINGFHQKRV